MRYALPGSLLVHGAILGIGLLGFVWPQADDAPAPGAVTVDIVTTDTVSANQTATVEASDTVDRVSAGSEQVTSEPVQSQLVEPIPAPSPALLQPVEPPLLPASIEPVAPQAAPTAEPLTPRTLAAIVPPSAPLAILAVPTETLTGDIVAPTLTETIVEASTALPPPLQDIARLEPVATAEVPPAPVPQTLSFARPTTPTLRPQRQAAAAAPPRQSGNGGRNNVDTAASKAAAGQQGAAGGGGTADIAPWERQVRRALANARSNSRATKGASGDVVVRFTVSADGALSALRIAASSGNPVLDQAALDTVTRAAPFPAMPQNAGVASKTLDIPLRFTRN